MTSRDANRSNSEGVSTRSLIEALPLLAFASDANGQSVQVNRRWLEYTGLEWTDHLELSGAEAIHPNDRTPVLEAWQSAVGKLAPFEIEYRLRRGDGAYRWHLARAEPVFDHDGASLGWIGTATDVTDRRRAEERARIQEQHYRRALQTSGLIAARVDRDLRYTWIYNPHPDFDASSVIGKRDDELAANRSAERLMALKRRVLETNTAVREEIDFPLSDGLRVYEVRGEPLLDEDGVVTGLTTVSIDITEVKRAQENERQLHEIQKRFVSDAAHELRAPLTAIRGNLGLLSRFPDIPTEERAEMLGDAERESARLARLITDLLTLARGEAGQHLEFFPVQLDELVASGVRDAKHLVQDHQLRLEPLPKVTVLGNRDALKQLTFVLLENALKYTPSNGTVRVSLDVEGDEVCLRVVDNGPGIAAQDLERVFERFYRVDRARARGTRSEGMGLGLAIARQIVERHGGTVRLESTVGVGTTAVVRLPLAPKTKTA